MHLDAPLNASFVNPATRLFDFPVAAALIGRRAVRRTIRSVVLHVASDEDLLQLKRIAHADRAFASDAQDIAFLETRLRRT